MRKTTRILFLLAALCGALALVLVACGARQPIEGGSADDLDRKLSTFAYIEQGDLGVDELAEKVARVTTLLKICRDRLYKTEEQINKILDERTS